MAIWAVFSTVTLVWLFLDGQPQGCDQANHLMRSMDLSSALADGDFVRVLGWWAQDRGVYTYPPLFHTFTGAFVLLGARPALAAGLVNLLFLWLLISSLIRIGRLAFSPTVGVVAGILTAMYPMVAQLQHEAFIDFALTAMTSWCVWRLLAADGFCSRRASIALGVSVGVGLLLKQLIILYLLGPALALVWVWRRTMGRAEWANAGLAACAAAACALPWYGLHAGAVLSVGAFNQRVALVEGDPMPWTLPGAIFYPHAMASLQAGFCLFVLALVSCAWLGWRFVCRAEVSAPRRTARAAVIAWLVVGLGLLTFAVLNKDARYSMPILPALALVTASPLSRIRSFRARVAGAGLVLALAFPYFTNGLFSWPDLRRSVAFRTGSLWWMVWKQDFYYGSAPARDDWGLGLVLDRVSRDRERAGAQDTVRLGLVPFLLRVNANSVLLEARKRGVSLEVYQFGSDPGFVGEGGILSCDYVLTKTGNLGLAFETSQADRIGDFIASRPGSFRTLDTFALPDGSTGVLLEVVGRGVR